MQINTLKTKKQFDYVYKRGKSFANKNLVIYHVSSKYPENLVGISISKKVGKAVKRNYLRRIIKENLKEISIKPYYNFIVLVRTGSEDMDFKEMKKSLNHVFKKTGLLEN